jgi:hypothetical protein
MRLLLGEGRVQRRGSPAANFVSWTGRNSGAAKRLNTGFVVVAHQRKDRELAPLQFLSSRADLAAPTGNYALPSRAVQSPRRFANQPDAALAFYLGH